VRGGPASAEDRIQLDEDYLDAAVRYLVYQAERFDPDDLYGLNGHLAVGDAAHAFAVGYDWLYPHMTNAQRILVRETVEQSGYRIYRKGWYPSPDEVGSSTNHNAVVNGGLGLAAPALRERVFAVYPDVCTYTRKSHFRGIQFTVP